MWECKWLPPPLWLPHCSCAFPFPNHQRPKRSGNTTNTKLVSEPRADALREIAFGFAVKGPNNGPAKETVWRCTEETLGGFWIQEKTMLWILAQYASHLFSDTLQPWKNLSLTCVSYWLEMFRQSKLQSHREKKIPLRGGCPNETREWSQRLAGTSLVAGSWHLPRSLKTCVQRKEWLADCPAFWIHLRKELLFLLEEGEGIGQEKAPGTPLLCVLAKRLSRIWLFVMPGTVAPQAPLSLGLSRQEYWSGCPSPPPGDLQRAKESAKHPNPSPLLDYNYLLFEF